MRLVQFELATEGRRVGVVQEDLVLDLTAAHAHLQRTFDLFAAAEDAGMGFEEFIGQLLMSADAPSVPYPELLAGNAGSDDAWLHPPLDHHDPYRLLVSGTGLTHTGGMKSRDEMHTADEGDAPQTDSAKIFAMGLEGGKPSEGRRGAMPEWFYKGNGLTLRGPGGPLELPAFALDGGEEPELVGCYIIDSSGVPCRLGFALGIEWSDHETEQINYLYLAPSKLRTCAVGPELITDCEFGEVHLRCTVHRGGKEIYDSGPLLSGEDYMCHSLANCEDHHFKYPQHRSPGDVHLHFFGTSKLSHSTRDWKFAAGDEISVSSEDFSEALVARVEASAEDAASPVRVRRV